MSKISYCTLVFFLFLSWNNDMSTAQSLAMLQINEFAELGSNLFVNKENSVAIQGYKKDRSLNGNYRFLKNSSAPGGRNSSIYFVGDGNIQKSFSEGSGLAANTGLGVVFFREWDDPRWQNESDTGPAISFDPETYEEIIDSTKMKERLKNKEKNKKKLFKIGNPFQDIEFSLKINVASTADTIIGKSTNNNLLNRRDFGTYLLIPTNSKQAANFDFYGYFHHRNNLTQIINGINVNFTASNSIWKIDSTTSFLAGAMLRTGVFYDFVPDDVRKSDQYSVTVGINYSIRVLLGDLSFSSEDAKRNLFLGTKEKFFSGPEIVLGIRLQNIRAEVSMPFLNARNADIPGLTSAQFVTSIRFVGGFPLKIK